MSLVLMVILIGPSYLEQLDQMLLALLQPDGQPEIKWLVYRLADGSRNHHKQNLLRI